MEASRVRAQAAPAAWGQVLADYVTLTKPRVQLLLLLTTIATMYVAGDPSPGLVLLTCLGGSLSAGGAAAVNHYWDRDIDAQMSRTATRPVPAGRIAPGAALGLGLALGALSFVELAGAGNPLSGVLPGSLDPAALYLFAIVFYWTPPHFWALSLLMKDEYARVGVPMMPVVHGEAETRRQIVLYTALLVVLTLLPVVFGFFGAIYAAAAVLLGGAFLVLSVRLQRGADRRSALRTYLYSLAYLALLFGAMVADARL